MPDNTKAELVKVEVGGRFIASELRGFSLVEALNLTHMLAEYEKILECLAERIRSAVLDCWKDIRIPMLFQVSV